MGKFLRGVLCLGLVACGGEDPPPSCQQAVTHYYGVGCVLTSGGMELTSGEAHGMCQDLLLNAPSQCYDDLDDFRSCMGDAPGGSNAGCDCSQEIDALFTCE